jgi:hypothetical protein
MVRGMAKRITTWGNVLVIYNERAGRKNRYDVISFGERNRHLGRELPLGHALRIAREARGEEPPWKKHMYLRLTERNDWEGETWHFFIRIQGNEEALNKIAAAVVGSEEFHIDPTEYTEEEVDRRICDDPGSGYMPMNNKLVGILKKLPATKEKLLEKMYKGGIRKFQKMR